MTNTKELKALIVLAGKIDPSLQSAMLKATGQSQKLSQSLKQTSQSLKTSSIFTGTFLGSLASNAVSYSAYQLKNLAAESIMLASDLNEVQNVVDVTFGKGSEQINEWSKQTLKYYGLSELQAKKFAGTMGAMLKSSGVSGDYIVQMSENLSSLSGDMASFYNLDAEEAFEKIRSGISGETEPLKQLGINMSVANLEAYAMSKGIKTAYEKMDQASQATLRYNYLLDTTKDAQGDFLRTQDGFANQWRLFKTGALQTGAAIAQKLLPHLDAILIKSNNFIQNADVDAWAAKASYWFDTLAGSVQWVIDNWSWLGPIGEQLVGTFIALKVIGEVTSLIYGLKEAMALLNLSLNGCALFLLINALVWLITHWDVVKEKLTALNGAFKPQDTGEIQMFAEGGIANRPSIFGEDGPEIAIPLQRSSRSMALLDQAAQILGVRGGSGGVHIVYSPVIQGGSGPEVLGAARQSFEEFKSWADKYFEEKERSAYGY